MDSASRVPAAVDRMPLFMTDSELEAGGGNVEVVVLKADAFIRNLQEQLEAQKQACADFEKKYLNVWLFYHLEFPLIAVRLEFKRVRSEFYFYFW